MFLQRSFTTHTQSDPQSLLPSRTRRIQGVHPKEPDIGGWKDSTNVTTKEVGMKNILPVFKITQQQVDEVCDLLFLNNAGLTYKTYVAIHADQQAQYDHAVEQLGIVQVELVMMYLAFRISIELRREMMQTRMRKSDWRKVNHLEKIFLDLTRTAEHVPAEVLAKAHVIHQYWAYLELDQSDTNLQPGTD